MFQEFVVSAAPEKIKKNYFKYCALLFFQLRAKYRRLADQIALVNMNKPDSRKKRE